MDSFTNHKGDAYSGFKYAPDGFLFTSMGNTLVSVEEIRKIEGEVFLTAMACLKLGIKYDKKAPQSRWGTFDKPFIFTGEN